VAINLSVIIPVLNEAKTLPRLLTQLQSEGLINPQLEVIMVDGGSTDGSRELAIGLGARVVTCPPGRSEQLNKGAALAQGEVMVFLHADSQIPPGFSDQIIKAVDSGYLGGAHRIVFSPDNGLLKLIAWGSNLRGKYRQNYYGDQGIFVTKDVFQALGGFPDQELMEDLEFGRRLKKLGTTFFLPGPLITSSRRFTKNGIIRTLLLMQWLKLLYKLGVSTKRLKKLYKS
jgi:rSAM/selenodomain-associated transferase 2